MKKLILMALLLFVANIAQGLCEGPCNRYCGSDTCIDSSLSDQTTMTFYCGCKKANGSKYSGYTH